MKKNLLLIMFFSIVYFCTIDKVAAQQYGYNLGCLATVEYTYNPNVYFEFNGTLRYQPRGINAAIIYNTYINGNNLSFTIEPIEIQGFKGRYLDLEVVCNVDYGKTDSGYIRIYVK